MKSHNLERQIVQIAISETDDNITIVALCNDKTLWFGFPHPHNSPMIEWFQLPNVPQPEMEAE